MGYEGTHFREITELSGVKRALILYHFKSKEALWKKAVQTISDRFNQLMIKQLEKHASDDSDEAQLRKALNAFIDALIEMPAFGQILLREGTSPGPRLDWLAKHFAPPSTTGYRFKNKALARRVSKTIIRDIFSATLISMVTLGPLLDASLAAALHTKSAGIHPLSARRKAELVDLMVKLVLAD